MIKVTGLSKRYGSHLAVEDVNFQIAKGEVIGFLGPNGAGKSTIMNILTGYLSLTQGKVEIDGFDIMENPEQAKRRIGYLPEIPPLYLDMTVNEYLNFVYDLKKVKFPKRPHINEILKLVKIDHVQGRLIKNLSKGYRQRVGIAQALVGNPDVLILDEPTVGLDPKQIIEIRNLIARLGKNHTIILSSHILSEIQAVCERVIIINQGHIVADDTPEMLSKSLSKDHSLIARVVGEEKDVTGILKSVLGVESVVCLGKHEEGSLDYSIEPEAGVDIRAGISTRLAERKKQLLSLSSNELTLEQIFLRLTDETQNSRFAVEEEIEKQGPAIEIDEQGDVVVKEEPEEVNEEVEQ